MLDGSKNNNINNKKDAIKKWEKKPRDITDNGFNRGEAHAVFKC